MSQISKQALIVDNNQSFPTNNAGEITPSDLRAFNVNMIDSLVNEIPYQLYTASVNNSISSLNTFTASQQPSFNALNSFTASQLTINTGYNAATYSLNTSVNSLTAEVDQLQTWSGSVNQIQSSGITQGYATRFNFSGLMTASITPNVNGAIADISLVSDTTRVSTASFNAYTASTNSSISNLNAFTASQISFDNSATASIVQLLSFSSSLDATYATDAQLNASASTLQANIDTKLNTSSFNSYSQSVATAINSINNNTGSFATTGSNTFVGNQVLTGSLIISSSAAVDLQVTGAIGVTTQVVSSGSTGQVVMSNVAIAITSNAQSSSATYGRNIMQQRSGSNTIGLGASPAQSGLITGLTNPSVIIQSGSIDGVFGYYAPIQFQKGLEYTDGRTTFTTPLIAQSGSIITGSVLGNIIPLTISSNTASMDLSKGNFFTLTLVSGSSTQLTATNIKAGQTVNLLITQANPASGSLTYNSTFKFPVGNGYIATAASASKDIITFITFDSSTIYAAAINNLV